MRIELKIKRSSKGRMMPMDYSYYISAWVYKVLKNADADFATFLHEKGYGESEVKRYKLFCFSRLNFGKPILWREKHLFEIKAHEVSLQLSFDVNEVASTFIKGLFVDQDFYIGDKFNGIDFRVEGVVVLDEPVFSTIMNYRLQSPWVVSFQDDNHKYAQYLSPDDDRFMELAKKHITEKMNTVHGKQISPNDLTLQLTSDYKRKGFLIKPGTSQQTRVIGSEFNFQLDAPIAVHQMLWNAGVCEKSSLGFGWLEVF